MTKSQRSDVTTEIDAELKRLGFRPTEISIKGRMFIAALAANVNLRGQIARLIAGGYANKLKPNPSGKRLSKRENKRSGRP